MVDRVDKPLIPEHQGYSIYFRVRYHEMDSLGHVHNANYLHYLEEAAIQHSTALGYDTPHLHALGGLFIARRHEIDYLRPAVAGDLLQVVTWAAEMSGARAMRKYIIYRRSCPADQQLPANGPLDAGRAEPGEEIVRATTLWVWVGVDDHRPRRIPAHLRADFLRTQEGFLSTPASAE